MVSSGTFKTLGGILGFRALGELMARARIAAVTGKTFGGDRDLYEALGYSREITTRMFRERYQRNAVAARLVEARPEDTWRGGFEVYEDPDPAKETKFETEWNALYERLKIGAAFQKADILAGLGRYAVILIGAPGNLDEPLEKVAGPQDIRYLGRYAEEDAVIETLEENEQDPRFGHPVFYRLTRTAVLQGRRTTMTIGKRVHYSRIIHVSDGLLDDDIYGTPRLERHWNLLDDLEKVTGGGAEAFWRRSDGGTQVDLDPTINLNPAQQEEMKQEVEDFVHGYKRFIRTRGLKINRLGSDVANFLDPVKAIIEQMSAGSGIPQRVLMGSEQGKLAAEQDSVKYYRGIEARREDYAATLLVRPFVNKLVALGALSQPKEYFVSWSQIKQQDDDEKVTLAKNMAAVNQTAGEVVFTTDEIREKVGYEPLSEIIDRDDSSLTSAERDQRRLERALRQANVPAVEALLRMIVPEISGPSPVSEDRPVTLNLLLGKKGSSRHKIIHDQDGIAVAIEAEE
jgi:hypothetical protein